MRPGARGASLIDYIVEIRAWLLRRIRRYEIRRYIMVSNQWEPKAGWRIWL